MSEIALVDRIICAAAQIWKDDGEVLATGIGIVPRLAASLCAVLAVCIPQQKHGPPLILPAAPLTE